MKNEIFQKRKRRKNRNNFDEEKKKKNERKKKELKFFEMLYLKREKVEYKEKD